MRTRGFRFVSGLLASWILVPPAAVGDVSATWVIAAVNVRYVPGDHALSETGVPSPLRMGKDDALWLANVDINSHTLTADMYVCPTVVQCEIWQKVPAFDTATVRNLSLRPAHFVSYVKKQGGIFPFHCKFHSNMRGSLTIE